MKKNKVLKAFPFKLNDSFGSDLVPFTWGNKISIKEVDRNHVPILPNAGFVRLKCGVDGSFGACPLDGPDPSPLTVEPVLNWGKKNTLIRIPRGALIGGFDFETSHGTGIGSFQDMFFQIAGDAVFTGKLSDHKILLGRGTAGLGDSSNLFLRTDTYPVDSPDQALWWSDNESGTPLYTFDGGDLIIVYNLYPALGINYYNPGLSNYRPSLATDIASLVTASALYRSFRIKWYLTSNDSLLNDISTHIQDELIAAGIDAIFGGPSTSSGFGTIMENDVLDFYGL